MRKCLTPGSIYNIDISSSTVSVMVELPMDLDLDEVQAINLEDQLHDAMEQVLKQFFKKD